MLRSMDNGRTWTIGKVMRQKTGWLWKWLGQNKFIRIRCLLPTELNNSTNCSSYRNVSEMSDVIIFQWWSSDKPRASAPLTEMINWTVINFVQKAAAPYLVQFPRRRTCLVVQCASSLFTMQGGVEALMGRSIISHLSGKGYWGSNGNY